MHGTECCRQIPGLEKPWSVSKVEPDIRKQKEKIVFDRFHILGHVGKAVDTVRRREHRALMATEDETPKGAKSPAP